MSNSLANVHPELVCKWSDRNLPLTPDTEKLYAGEPVITKYRLIG